MSRPPRGGHLCGALHCIVDTLRTFLSTIYAGFVPKTTTKCTLDPNPLPPSWACQQYVFIAPSPVQCEHCFSTRLSGKESGCSAGNPDSIPRSGKFPGEGNGNPLQYSCLENFMDRRAWQATVLGDHKESDTTERPNSSSMPKYRVDRKTGQRWMRER